MKLKSILLATALVCGAPAMASAQEAEVSYNLGAASSYQFRGVNQNVSDEIQVFGGMDIAAGDFYVGTWLSNVDFDTKSHLEVDAYAGYKPKVGPVQLDLGVLAYLYPQESDLRIFEAKAAATIANEAGFSLTGSAFYSPEAGKDGPSYWYGELAVAAPIPGAKFGPFSLSANASVGTADYDTNDVLPDYSNYKVGLTAATESGWAVDLFFTDTDISDSEIYKEKTVLQIKRSF
ncbi:MAG: hypothetical protein RL186_68 [Pseudomonadota bacterium]|jgi:uncharacterized protein (TIGR02001 family)